MVNAYLIVSAIIAILAVALGAAYTTGALDPVIEKIGVYFFKAKAKAEEKKMEAQGEKEGEDFLASKISHLTRGEIELNNNSRSIERQQAGRRGEKGTGQHWWIEKRTLILLGLQHSELGRDKTRLVCRIASAAQEI